MTGARYLLLPGLDATGTLHERFLAALGAESEVVPYPVDRPLGYAELADLVAPRVTAGTVLVGESFSGPLALRLAARLDVRAVALVASFVACPMPWARFAAAHAPAAAFAVALPRPMIRRWLVGEDADAALVQSVQAALSSVRPAVLAAGMREIGRCDAMADLRAVRAPILYVRGLLDRLVGASAVDVLVRERPDATVVEIDAPHLVLQRRPEEAAAAISALASVR